MKYIHDHPANIAGYVLALLSGLVNLATDPSIHGILAGLPQSSTVQAVSAVLTCVAAVAAAYRNPAHAAETAAADAAKGNTPNGPQP